MKKPPKALKQFPVLRTDEEAEDFVANADLSEYDFSGFRPAHFEFAPKNANPPSAEAEIAPAKTSEDVIARVPFRQR